MSHTIITISRQYGSGGRQIGHLLADRLWIPCYDRTIIDQAAEISEMSSDFIEKNEQKLTNSILFNINTTAKIYKAESKVIQDCAEKGNCVIVGRCADKVLEKDYDCLKVFLYADFNKRCQYAVSEYGKDKDTVEAYVKKADKGRERFFRLFHESEWGRASNYNLCLDTGLLGTEGTVELICQAYDLMKEAKKNE